MPRTILVFLLFACASCESPEERISRLQSELLKALGERDYFEIDLEKQKIRLPLPPSPELAEARKTRISELKKEADAFQRESLSDKARERLELLTAQLNEVVKRGAGAFFDPVKCVLSAEICDKLRKTGPESDEMLQRLPAYYIEVERRWQIPDRARAQLAAEQSLLVLDQLESAGKHTLPVRLSVKDYIGLCRSSLLLR